MASQKLIYDTRQLPVCLDVGQTAKLLRVTTKTAYKLINDGDIQAKKVGAFWRIPKTNVLAYLGIEESIDG